MLPYSLRALAISEATIQACTTARAETKQKPATAPRSACMPRTKRARTPPLNPRSTAVMTKAIRCHMMNSRQRMVHHTYPYRYMASLGHDIIRLRMSHTIKNKQKMILRSKRIRGQFEALRSEERRVGKECRS